METAHPPGTQFSLAEDEVENRAELGKVGRPELTADLQVVARLQPHGCRVLIHKHLPLQGGRKEEQEVSCKDRRRGRGPQEGLPCPPCLDIPSTASHLGPGRLSVRVA